MGTKELVLIAQDLTYYGLEKYGERKLADLVRNLSDVPGIDWIRMQYAYPSQFPMEVLDVMARARKHVQIPRHAAAAHIRQHAENHAPRYFQTQNH